MRRSYAVCALILLVVVFRQPAFCADLAVPQKSAKRSGSTILESVLGLPPGDDTVQVRTAFQLLDIHEIDEEKESFEFSGVLTLKWLDKRQAFDPAEAGVSVKVYQGAFQVNELSPAWYPQVVLANTSGLDDSSAVVLLVGPDGNSTLIQTINAIAEARLNLRRTPFDAQRLEAVFEVFGFDAKEVTLVAEPMPERTDASEIRIPQWTLNGVEHSIRTIAAPYAEKDGVASAFVLTVDVQRQSWFMLRLVMIPLTLIVVLSWSVFWMDRSSLGDRMSVSFVGILTAVTYQIVLGDMMPQISYLTFMNGFLNISFIVMAATVVINLIVGAADKKGQSRMGDQIDRCSRIGFPLIYFGLLTASLVIAFLCF